VLAVAGMATVAEARYCQSPWCAMCARMFGPMPGYKLVEGDGWGRVVRMPEPERQPVVDATPHQVVSAMLGMIHPTSSDVLYDLGCGDGRIMIEAIRTYGCQAVGIEIDPMVADLARKNLEAAGIPRRWRVVLGDARNYRLHKATIATMYLFPETMAQLVPKLTHARAIVSYSHEIPGLSSLRYTHEDMPYYIWERQDAPELCWPVIQPQFPSLIGNYTCPTNLPH